MGIIELVTALVVIGVILYLINNFLPIDGKIKQLINIVIIVAIIIWLLRYLSIIL